MRSLASDNYAGIHPLVLAAIGAANADHAPAYGSDAITEQAVEIFRRELGDQVEVFMTFNGTGANVVGLQSLMRTWEAVICASTAHINVDEGGAPEKLLGSKIIDLQTPDGKLTPELINSVEWRNGDVHQSQPKVVLITQSTEYGTCYSPAEIRAIADAAHGRGLALYLDGARIANAAASFNVSLRAMTTDAGVDVMSFGGTKNGAMSAEAVIVLNPALNISTELGFIRKQYMQLSSKMRFTSAQFIALLSDELWRVNAAHANSMAQRLVAGIKDIPGLVISQPTQANAVFARLPAATIPRLQAHTPFYVWSEINNEVRWVCSWDTTAADIDEFIDAVRQQLS
ncbi:MAG: beta-eliminating lyase-related protein [Actinomycetota bacterium]|nr:beta-eliminating lyase-related protein [Actinomycetota bacterium]